MDALRGHKWQQHTEIKRHIQAEEWDFCLAAQILNPLVTASPGRTAEVCSSGSQKGLKPLGFTRIRIYNFWIEDRDVLERAGLYHFCTA